MSAFERLAARLRAAHVVYRLAPTDANWRRIEKLQAKWGALVAGED